MEPAHVKKALFFLDRVHLSAIQNEGDRSLQYAIEGISSPSLPENVYVSWWSKESLDNFDQTSEK